MSIIFMMGSLKFESFSINIWTNFSDVITENLGYSNAKNVQTICMQIFFILKKKPRALKNYYTKNLGRQFWENNKSESS